MLNHEAIRPPAGDPARWLLFTHGIYGAGRNWNSVARRVIAERSGTGAVMVDLREHGGSIGRPGPHTIEAAAQDVVELMDSLDAPVAGVVGHSFGGKVMLMLARLLCDYAPAELWIIDSTPATREEPAGSAWEMLATLRAAPGPFESRGDAVARLESLGVATPTAQWVSSNLERGPDGSLAWRIDFDVMEELLHSFFETDLWDVVEDPPAGSTIHFVKATDSSVLDDEAVRRIEAAGRATGGRVRLHEVRGGHWLNADNPDGVVQTMANP